MFILYEDWSECRGDEENVEDGREGTLTENLVKLDKNWRKKTEEDKLQCIQCSLDQITFSPLFPTYITEFHFSSGHSMLFIFREFECFVNIYFIAVAEERSNLYHQWEGFAGIEIRKNSIAAVVPVSQPPCCPCTCSWCVIPTFTL